MKLLIKSSIVLSVLGLSGCGVFDDDSIRTNTAPIAIDLMVSTVTDTPIMDNLLATDVDYDPLTYSLIDSPANGTVVVDTSGSFSYSPDSEFTGEDSFTFIVNDGEADSMVASVLITVDVKQETFSLYSRKVFQKGVQDSPEGVNGRTFIDDVTSTDEYQDLIDSGTQQ